MAGDGINAGLFPDLRTALPRETADPLAVDVGVVVLVDRAQVQFEIAAHPFLRDRNRATEPEHAIFRMALFLPAAGNRHLAPLVVGKFALGPALGETAISGVLGRAAALPVGEIDEPVLLQVLL